MDGRPAVRGRSYAAYVWARGPARLVRAPRRARLWGRRPARREISDWAASAPRRTELSVCIPSRGRDDLLLPCLRSIARTAGRSRVEVVVADTGGTGAAARIESELGLHAIEVGGPFNFADACNRMAAAAGGRRLLFLNDDTEALAAGWAERLMAAPDDEVIGALLLYPGSDRVQHSGVEAHLGPGSAYRNHYGPGRASSRSAGLALRTVGLGRPASELGPGPELEMLAVSGAALSVSARRFREAGGFDSGYEVDLQDYDLCMRLRDSGCRVLCRTDVVFSHRGGATRGFYGFPTADWERFTGRWGSSLERSAEPAAALTA